MNPLIVALDFESAAQAREVVKRLGEHVGFYKAGLELYTASGMDFVRELIAQGKDVFLDLKLFDISETVKRAVARIAESGVRFTTVHSSLAVMSAAMEGCAGSGLKVLAVTVLTSFDQSDLADLGYTSSVQELVALRVRKAVEAGVDGLICSPMDAAAVRRVVGPKKLIVTPGVRSAGAGKGDQKRIATPGEAMAAGADYLVIGRQVTRAADPLDEVQRICAEIEC